MPPLPIINGVIRCAMNWSSATPAQTAENVMHFQMSTPSQATLLGLLNTNVTSAMWNGVQSNYQIRTITMTTLDGSSASITYSTTGTGWTPAVSTGDFMPQVAGLVSLKTATRGRRARGRIYLPFITEAASQSGQFQLAITAWQSAWTTFVANMQSGNAPMVVASYGHSLIKHKNPDGSITLTPVSWTPQAYPVTAAVCEVLLGTLRKRQTRVRGG